MIRELAERIQETQFSQYLSGSAYAFPVVETVHVFALLLVLSSIFVVDLRLIGISSRRRSVRELSETMLPITWGGFAIALVSGLVMVLSKPASYLHNAGLQWKFGMIALAGLNVAVFHLITYRSVDQWDVDVAPPLAARISGCLSLLLWVGITYAARWAGFLH